MTAPRGRPPIGRRRAAGAPAALAAAFSCCRAAALAGALLAAFTAAAPAQVPGSDSLLRRPARLEVRAVTLAAALAELGRSSEVRLAWSPGLLSRSGRVSCACRRATVAQALDTLLAGTELTYREAHGRVVVMPRPSREGDASRRSGPPEDILPRLPSFGVTWE